MKRFWILLLFGTLRLFGQNEFGPVEPALFTPADPYLVFLKQTVFRTFGGIMPLQFCAVPSFQPEWGLQAWLAPSGAVRLRVCEAPTNLFAVGRFADEPDQKAFTPEQRSRLIAPTIKIRQHEFELPRALGERLIATWHRVLFNATINQRSLGLDGTRCYYFADDERSNRTVAAQRWSPPIDTDAGRLAALASALRDCRDGDAAHRDKLMKALEVAESRLVSGPPLARADATERAGFLRTKRSGAEVLRLAQDELRRRNKPVVEHDPEVLLQSVAGRLRWCLTWSVPQYVPAEIMTVFIDDGTGEALYSGNL